MSMARYTIRVMNDLMVVITDDDAIDLPTITNSAAQVIADLDSRTEGLGVRRVYYRDSVGRYDELCHKGGVFKGFAVCKPSQQEAFRDLVLS
jgi:hypothetical protein